MPPKQQQWDLRAIHQMRSEADMVDEVKGWLEQQDLDVATRAPARSMFQEEVTYYSQCVLHRECERKYRFATQRQEGQTFLVIQQRRICAGEVVDRIAKKKNATKFCTATAHRAMREMVSTGVPTDQRPSVRQMENKRQWKKR
eukprot:6498993-Alexandrium_andersonii.AAC.1